MRPGGQGGISGAAVVAAAVCVTLLALAPRVLPSWSEVVQEGRVVVRDPDACYHLRRADRIARGFPTLALFDPFVNFPRGGWVIWPPLYDLTLAGVNSLFPTGDSLPGPRAPVALLPPFLFAGTTLAVFAFARRLWPRRLGLAVLAAGIPALLPASAPYTTLGQLDHHAAELLCLALFLLAMANAAAAAVPAAGRSALRAALAPGVALAAALLVQLTLVILVPFVLVPALCAPRAARARALDLAVATLLVALALVLPWGLAYGAAGVPFAHFRFALFQPALVAVALFGGLSLRAIVGPVRPGLPRAALAVGAGLIALGIGALLAGETARGAAYIARTFAPWQATISESRSLLQGGFRAGIEEVARTLSCLGFLLPAAAVLAARGARRDDPHRALLLAALLVFGAMGILQTRFLAHISLFVGIAAATVVAPLVAPPERAARSWARTAAVAGAVLLALLPARRLWATRDEAAIAFDRARPLLDYLARETAPPAPPDWPEAPRYGVLAEWSYGHFIQYYGQRPAVVDNFGNHAGDPTRVRAFFLATDESAALAFADSNRVRYVLVADLPAMFGGLIPDEPLIRRYLAQTRLVEPGQGVMRFSEEVVPTLLYRLTSRYGSVVVSEGRTVAPPLAHMALVAESAEGTPGDPSVAMMKLYEIVAGARIRVEGIAPRAEGLLLATIRSGRGRTFPYAARLVAGADGAAEITFPYPTEIAPGGTGAERCEIDLGRETLPVTGISAAMVREGAGITVRPAGPATRETRTSGAP